MQYKQNAANMSCDALHQLQLNLEGFVNSMGAFGIKNSHVTFVDDLLFLENHTLLKAVHGGQLTVLGGCACLAALAFFS